METTRQQKISRQIQRDIADIFQKEAAAIVRGSMVTVTTVRVSPDFGYAKIYVSVLEDDKRDDLLAALKSASGYIRRALGKGILIRYSPELTFVSDENIAYGVHIAKVLADAQKTENHHDEDAETP